MKSAFLLLLIERSAVGADECKPPDNDEIWIECVGAECSLMCANFDENPPFDTLECDVSTGQPVQPYPTSCQPYNCPTIEPANNLVVECPHSKVASGFENFDFLSKCRFFCQNVDFLSKCRFFVKMSIFCQNFDFLSKFRFLSKISPKLVQNFR